MIVLLLVAKVSTKNNDFGWNKQKMPQSRQRVPISDTFSNMVKRDDCNHLLVSMVMEKSVHPLQVYLQFLTNIAHFYSPSIQIPLFIIHLHLNSNILILSRTHLKSNKTMCLPNSIP